MKMHLFNPYGTQTMCGRKTKSFSTFNMAEVDCARCKTSYKLRFEWWDAEYSARLSRNETLKEAMSKASDGFKTIAERLNALEEATYQLTVQMQEFRRVVGNIENLDWEVVK